MKKITLLFYLLFLFSITNNAQVNTYLFTQSNATYTPITGGTVLGAITDDEQLFTTPTTLAGSNSINTGIGFPIGFNFTFAGYVYDRFAVDTNGWVSLGQSAQTPSVNLGTIGGTNLFPISLMETSIPTELRSRISPFGRDLMGQTGSELRFELVGTAPSRELVVQWKNYRSFNQTGQNYNFQIRIKETSNIVSMVYGSMTFNTAAQSAEVGLVGTSSADFNNRRTPNPNPNWNSSIAGTVNTNTCSVGFNTTPPASGLTFTYTPTTPCVSNPPIASVTPTAATICPAAIPASLVATGIANTITGLSFQWEQSNDNFSFSITNAIGGSGASTLTYTPPAMGSSIIYYRLKITCANSGSISYSNIVKLTPNLAQITPTFTAVSPICSGGTLAALPTTSTNGITGTWLPALNNTTTTTYTFIPTAGQCATTTTITITVNPIVTPTFTAVAPICDGDALATLPTTSNNGITGTWSPVLDNTTTTSYTFTPTAGQCATTTTLTITVNLKAIPTFSALGNICAGTPVSPLPTTSNNGITGTWSPAFDNTTTKTYLFTPTAGQCARTNSKIVTIIPNVTPTFTAVAPVCAGTTLVTLPTTSNNSITGTWAPALDNTTTTTYTFTPTAGQCANTATMTITVNPSTTPTFTAVTPICAGTTLVALPTTSNNGITGTWSPALDYTTTTTYTFTPTAGQCANTATMTITVNPSTTPTFTAVTPICAGTTLVALPTTSNNGITGTWAPTLDNTTTTTYTFTPTAGQCANTAAMTITVNPNITPTFTAVMPICAGTTLAALQTTSNNGITGTWAPTLDNTTTTTYTFTPTAGQCANTAAMTITVNPNITPTFTAVMPICAGTTLAALQTTSNNGITGTWAPTLDNTTTTTYTFTPTAGQCANTATMTITVSSTSLPSVTSPVSYALGSIPNPLSASGSNLLWYTTATGGTGSSATPTPSTVTAGTTSFWVTQNTGSCGESDRAKIDVVVFPQASTLDFDGINDNVSIPDAPNLHISDNFTIEFWFKSKATTQSQKYLFSKNGTSGQYAIIYEYIDDQIEFYTDNGSIGDDPRVGSQIAITDTNWHHIAYTYDGVTWSGYKDGVVIFSLNKTFSLNPLSNTSLLLGASATGNNVAMALDEFKIWNRALPQAEIQNNLNCELASSGQTGLLLYYNFNQGFANFNNSGITTIYDKSAANNNGTLNNFALAGTTSNWVDNSIITTGTTCSTFLSTNEFYSDDFTFYPNPVKNVLNLSYSKNISSISIFNLLGQEISKSKIDNKQANVNMANLPNGIYFVKVISENAEKTVQIIKK